MNKTRQMKRQIYNKKALEKAQQANRTQRPKRNIGKEIIQELEQQDKSKEDSIKEEEQQKEEEEKKEDKPKLNLKEKVKPKKQKLKLDEKVLLYSDNGLKKYYETIKATTFDSKSDDSNLNKLTTLFRNWHFMLFPSYDVDFFTNKLVTLGDKPPTKSYMSRLRRIHKGEADWDIMYDEQNVILGKGTIMAEHIENPYKKSQPVQAQSQIEKKEENKIEDVPIEDLILEDIEELNKKEDDNEFKEIENDYDNISFHHEESETSSRIGGKRNYEQVKKESILNGTPIEETNDPLHKKELKLI